MQVTGKGCFRIFRFSESPLFQLYFRWQFVVSFVQQAVHCQRKQCRRPQQQIQFEKGNCRKQQGEKRTEKVPHETFFAESNLWQIHYRNALDVGQRGQFFRLRKQREGAVYVKNFTSIKFSATVCEVLSHLLQNKMRCLQLFRLACTTACCSWSAERFSL